MANKQNSTLWWSLIAVAILLLALAFYFSLRQHRGPLPVSSAYGMQIERVVSADGIEAWLVEDHSIPVISLSLLFPGGAALDPAGKEGLASMASSLLDEGAGDLDSGAFSTAPGRPCYYPSFQRYAGHFRGQPQDPD